MANKVVSAGLSFLSKVASGEISVLDKKSNNDKGVYLNGSISNYAKNLVMTFPTLCDNSLSIDTASMISRANERNIVTMLRLVLSAVQLKGSDGVEVLSKIHKNINPNMSLDDFMDITDNFASKYGKELNGAAYAECVREMCMYLKTAQKSFPVDSFNESSLNDYIVYNNYGESVVREASQKDIEDEIDQDIIGYVDTKNKTYIDNGLKANLQDKVALQRYRDDKNRAEEELKLKRNADDRAEEELKLKQNAERISYTELGIKKQADRRANSELDIKQKADNRAEREYKLKQKADNRAKKELELKQNADQRADKELALRQSQADFDRSLKRSQMRMDTLNRQLLDNEIKKNNELEPTVILVNVEEFDDANRYIGTRSMVAGVKSRLIPVDSTDIIERLVAKNKNRISFLNFIRATTGEISFVKDFLLCMNQAKLNAKNRAKRDRNSQMWDVLEVRSTKNNINKISKNKNDASAITTLVINQETVNYMANEYSFDIEKIANARLILDSYNLLGIVICDESISTAKFLYAGNGQFEYHAYSDLQRESNDRSMKQVINLLSQQNRR